jgi:EAL domain-containing protein (putative c-di-GMP-specific phosphodiesterase class I)
VLKIAKSFIDGVSGSIEESALARAIINPGFSLRLLTIAEGIEEADQWEQLRRLGCSMGQGYYLSRPRPARDITPLLYPAFPEEPHDLEAGAALVPSSR